MSNEVGVVLSIIEKRLLMRGVKTIAQLYDEICDPEGDSEWCRKDLSPLGLTQTGLCLDFYNDQPYRLITPWGQWDFAVNKLELSAVEAFMGELETIQIDPKRPALHGPLYAVISVKGHRLPEPKLYKAGDPIPDDRVARLEWKTMLEAARPF